MCVQCIYSVYKSVYSEYIVYIQCRQYIYNIQCEQCIYIAYILYIYSIYSVQIVYIQFIYCICSVYILFISYPIIHIYTYTHWQLLHPVDCSTYTQHQTDIAIVVAIVIINAIKPYSHKEKFTYIQTDGVTNTHIKIEIYTYMLYKYNC